MSCPRNLADRRPCGGPSGKPPKGDPIALQRLGSCLALGPPHDAPRMRQRQYLLRIYLKTEYFGPVSLFFHHSLISKVSNSHSFFPYLILGASSPNIRLIFLILQSLSLRAPSLSLHNQNNAFHYLHSFFRLVPPSGRWPCFGVLRASAGKFKYHMDQTLKLKTHKLTKIYRMVSPFSALITLIPLLLPVITSSTLALATMSAFPADLLSNLALASIQSTTVLVAPA